MKTFVVAKWTFWEIMKSKILFQTIMVSVGLALLTFVATQLTYGVPQRVALDVGLGGMALTSVGMAIFMGVGLLSKEIENRTIYMALSRPISRTSFLGGKVLGMVFALSINILIIGGTCLIFYFINGGKYQPLTFPTVLLTMLESILTLLLVLNFSLITNNVLAVLFTLLTYTIGHGLTAAQQTNFGSKDELFGPILKVSAWVIPNFSKINLRDYLLYEQHLPSGYIPTAFTYSICYAFFLFFLATIIFERKNLD